jgi:hypothetical protein
MAIDPGTISTVIGVASSLFGGKRKAKSNPFLATLNRRGAEMERLVDDSSLEDEDQRTLENFSANNERDARNYISAQTATDFSRNDQPLIDSERGVARGVAANAFARRYADAQAGLDSTRVDRGLSRNERVAGVATAGYGLQDNQNQRDAQAQAAANQGIASLGSAIPWADIIRGGGAFKTNPRIDNLAPTFKQGAMLGGVSGGMGMTGLTIGEFLRNFGAPAQIGGGRYS